MHACVIALYLYMDYAVPVQVLCQSRSLHLSCMHAASLLFINLSFESDSRVSLEQINKRE